MKTSSKVLVAVAVALVSLAAFGNKEHNTYMTEIKNGNKVVECHFQDRGWDIVAPERIKDFDESTNTFIFDNGSAQNCRVSTSKYPF